MTKIIRNGLPNSDQGLSIEYIDDGKDETIVYGDDRWGKIFPKK